MATPLSPIAGFPRGFALEDWLGQPGKRHGTDESLPAAGTAPMRAVPASPDPSGDRPMTDSPATPLPTRQELPSRHELPALSAPPVQGPDAAGAAAAVPADTMLASTAVTADAWVVALGFPDDAPPPAPSPGGSRGTNDQGPRILVQWDNGATDSERAEALAAVGGVRRELIHTLVMRAQGEGVMEVIQLDAASSLEAALASYRNTARVRFAEVDQFIQPQVLSNDPGYSGGSLWGMYSSDTPTSIGPGGTTNAFGSQAEAAWNRELTGSKSVFVGIIDEGFDFNHPDLSANSWLNPFDPVDGIDNDGNGYIDDARGWDFFSNNNSVYDGPSDDHGTHVAGTIGAIGGNGVGVAGVNWNVSMISVKFLGPTGGYISGAVQAVDYLTDLKLRHGLNIVASNNSWGGSGYFESLHNALIRAAKQDILFVAAAGNSASNNDLTPVTAANYNTSLATSSLTAASYDAVISVASITNTGSLSSFSNYGSSTVDLGAPGSSILSTLPGASYGSYSGTSMATPHVTGAIALYAASRPGASAAQIRSALLASTTPTASLAGKTVTGGRLNVEAFLGPTPSYAISALQESLAEPPSGATPFQFRITRSVNTSFISKISWIVAGSGSTPASAQDFVGGIFPSGEVSFAVGETEKIISINVAGDSLYETAERFSVSLDATSGDAAFSSPVASSFILNTNVVTTTATILGLADDFGMPMGLVVEAGLTDDPTPTLFGSLSAPLKPGESLRVLAGSTLLGHAVVNPADQTWSFTPPTALVSGTYSFSVQVADISGTTGPVSAPRSLTIDAIPPTVTITSNQSALKTGETATIFFAFSETPIPSFTPSAILPSSDGIISGLAVTSDPKIYTATFTPRTDSSGTASIIVAAGSYTDAAGNPGAAGYASAISYDTLAPTLVITSSATELIAGQTATISFTFSELPSGFSDSNITTEGGTLTGLAVTEDVKVYTATFTPFDKNFGTAMISVVPASYTDLAGNPGKPVSTLLINYDTLAPSVVISSSSAALIAGQTATISFAFSEVPTGFSASDITTSGGMLSGLAVTSDPKVYTATFTPTANSGGTASITVAAGSYTDAAGNPGGAGSTPALTYDTLPPSLAISSSTTSLKAGQSATITFSFSENPDSSFSWNDSSGDVVVSGGTLSAVSGTGLIRTAIFTPAANSSGSASITVAAGSYTDAAGNPGSNGSTPALNYDTLPPSLTITSNIAILKAGQTAIITFSFSEVPSGFVAADISATRGTISDLAVTSDPKVYTATFTPTANSIGTASITVAAGSYTDAAGNPGVAGASPSLAIDTTPPTTTATISAISDDSGLLQGFLANGASTDDTTPTISGTLSAPLAAGESLLLFNGSTLLGSASVSNLSWSFSPSLPATSATSYSLTARVASALGILGTPSTARSFLLDTTPPTTSAAITGAIDNLGLLQGTLPSAATTDDTTPTLTGTLSAALASGESLRVWNGSTLLGNAVVNNTARTWSYTPNPALTNGSFSFSVAVTDAAGNLAAASSTFSLAIDTTPPSLAISSSSPFLAEGGTATISFSFSEDPGASFAWNGSSGDVSVTGGSLSAISGSGLTRTATFTPTPNSSGTASIIVAAGSYTDAAGNPGGAAGLTTLTYDTRPPAGSRIRLYDASSSSLPDTQGWLAFGTGGSGSQSLSGTGTLLTSNASILDGAGYSNVDRFSGNLVNSTFPTLDRSVGFSLDVQLRLVNETHLSANRAGFSLTLLDQGSTPQGIEIGFWSTSIFSQAGGATPFQAIAQVVHGIDTSSSTNYSLRIFDQSYTLLANNRPVLGGPLQDYSQASLSPLLPFNPYARANFLFLGDNSSSASAQVELGGIALGLPLTGSAGADTMTGTAGADRLNGLDGNDRIEAGDGADWLIGGRGDDQLAGGAGDDLLIGGSGLDRFVFGGGSPFNAGALGLDSIVGFEVLEDRIVLARPAFTALGPGPSLDPSSFAVVDNDAAAASSDALITYNAQSGGMFYNPNGSTPGFAASPEGGGKFLQLLANASGDPFPLLASGNLQIL